jgi:hypothetical protein
MATCSNSVEITNCAICLETLNIPKYLPCLHTFCENCIAFHISTSFEKGNKASFPEVNLLALWHWWQVLHNTSLHSTQTNNAGSDFSSLSQD